MNRDTRNPRVPAAQPRRDANEVRVHTFFVSGCLRVSIPFHSLVNGYFEGR